jgi:multidrug transporter EmrE-like cation transporter
MNLKALLLILTSVGLSVLGQITLKIGMSSSAAQDAMADPSVARGYVAVLLLPAVIVGLIAYALSALVWLKVLSQLAVSMAAPFVALGMVLTMIAGAVFLGESVPPVRMVGLS